MWHIWYFKYVDCDFNVKNNFYQIFRTCYVQISPKNKNTQNDALIKIAKNALYNLAHLIFQIYDFVFNVKNDFYKIFTSF